MTEFTGSGRRNNVIKFSHNWNNKLDNVIFTTIRKKDVYSYYSQRLDEPFMVMLKGVHVGDAVLIECRVDDFVSIPKELLMVDTGTSDYHQIFKRFGVVDTCVILTFKRKI